MTLAAVDRLVHHATIFEMNVESYRRREALARKQRGGGRPANYATTKNVAPLTPGAHPQAGPATDSSSTPPSPGDST